MFTKKGRTLAGEGSHTCPRLVRTNRCRRGCHDRSTCTEIRPHSTICQTDLTVRTRIAADHRGTFNRQTSDRPYCKGNPAQPATLLERTRKENFATRGKNRVCGLRGGCGGCA